MTETNIWQLIISVLFTFVAGLVAIVYKDTIRRVNSVERKVSAVLMTQLLLLGRQDNVSPELLKAIREAITEQP